MTLPFESARISSNPLNLRSFIGGSDARIIMGADEAALLRLWREKRGEGGTQGPSRHPIGQPWVVAEELNPQRVWRNTHQTNQKVPNLSPNPVVPWIAGPL